MRKTILTSLSGFIFFSLIIVGCDSGGSSTVSTPEKLYLFNVGEYEGDLGGRAGADALVAAYSGKPSGLTKTAAFISVSGVDQLKDLPAKYDFPTDIAIYGPNGIAIIADDWADLMDGSIDVSLQNAGVVPTDAKGDNWWSGSTSDGTVAETCNGWTVNISSTSGSIGSGTELGSNWIAGLNVQSDYNYFVLGIGY